MKKLSIREVRKELAQLDELVLREGASSGDAPWPADRPLIAVAY